MNIGDRVINIDMFSVQYRWEGVVVDMTDNVDYVCVQYNQSSPYTMYLVARTSLSVCGSVPTVSTPAAAAVCTRCNMKNEYATPTQNYVCYECR